MNWLELFSLVKHIIFSFINMLLLLLVFVVSSCAMFAFFFFLSCTRWLRTTANGQIVMHLSSDFMLSKREIRLRSCSWNSFKAILDLNMQSYNNQKLIPTRMKASKIGLCYEQLWSSFQLEGYLRAFLHQSLFFFSLFSHLLASSNFHVWHRLNKRLSTFTIIIYIFSPVSYGNQLWK